VELNRLAYRHTKVNSLRASCVKVTWLSQLVGGKDIGQQARIHRDR
jgi:hypothetical protein